MASVVKFTDGTTTVTFDGATDGKISRYDILSPEVRTLTVSKITKDGEEMVAQSYRDVVETLELYISGTWSQITTTIRKLNRLWERVRRVQEIPIESDVYIQVQPQGDSEYWQSPLKSISTDLEPDVLDLRLAQGQVMFTVTITRAFYWEKTSEVELQLYNPGQSKGTGGKSISNASDNPGTARYNYLDIDNSDLVGDLPSRLRLKMTDTYNDADRNWRVYVSIAHKLNVANITHMIEGESCTQGHQDPGAADYVNFNAGYYRDISYSGSSEALLGRWALSQSFLAAAKSDYFMIYAKIWATSSTLYLRPRISAVGGLTVLWSGAQVKIVSGYDLHCFGACRIPPVQHTGGLTPFPEDFEFTCQDTSGVSNSVSVDYIYFMPMDRWRQLIGNGYGFEYLTWLMDDGITEQLYTDGWTPAGPFYNFVGYGPQLEVVPTPESSGKHRLYFLWIGNTYAKPGRTMTIQAWYKPRRKQL